jgi:hypothetical protein
MVSNPAYAGQRVAYRWQTKAVKERPIETGVTRKRRVMSLRAEDDPTCVVLPETTCPALVSPELAAKVRARLQENKTEWAGRPVADPLATLWRGMTVCGHCGGRLHTAQMHGSINRKYTCLGVRADKATGTRTPCPGGAFSMSAAQLDPIGWRDVLAWLSEEENVERFLTEWQDDSACTEQSASSRLAAVDATIADLRGKMKDLGRDIAETTRGESRRVLQQTLDEYADMVEKEEGKRANLLRESANAGAQAAFAREMREVVRVVAREAPTFDCAEQRATLKAFGAELTLWREGGQPEGWPQRYKITLHFTGWTGHAPITLPPALSKLSLTSCY